MTAHRWIWLSILAWPLAVAVPGPAGGILKNLDEGSPAEPAPAETVAAQAGGASIEISELAFSVAQLECFKENELIARATGFFYASGGDLYLITNRHVVRDERADHAPDKLKLLLHTDAADIRKNGVYVVPLYDHRGRPSWLEHPKLGKKADVVAIPLDAARVEREFVVRPFDADNHLPDEVAVQAGEDLIVIGYPLGMHDAAYNLPIVRRGTLASFYPIPFEGEPYFLMECRPHAGCSGSPVLTKPGGVMQMRGAKLDLYVSTGIYLLGVNSARVEKDAKRGGDEPLGLNAVWFTFLIPEIISQERGD
jgi:hypothetical protein